MSAVFFNLLINSAFSILAGILVVALVLWFFRVETGPWKVFLLTLPFAKVVYDVIRGVPANSVLFSGVDPFSLPPKHQILQVGAGLTRWGAWFSVDFSVQDLVGRLHAASIGDYLVLWLNRSVGSWLPAIVVGASGLIALLLISRRIHHARLFEQKRRDDRRRAEFFASPRIGGRAVDVYISDSFHGTPFTGGVLRPYICIPREAAKKLGQQEFEAVILHESAHVAHFDLFVTFLVQILGDLFWFIPGYRLLSRKIDRLREMVADQSAVERGADPSALASALLKIQELGTDSNPLYSAFFRERSLLHSRVRRLLGETGEPPSRFGWQYRWFRITVSFWIFMSVMFVTLGGNPVKVASREPELIERFLRLIGIV